MTKVLILYYSAYGHMERMAQAVAEGVRDAGVEADIKRVPELVPEEVAKQSGFKLDQKAPPLHRKTKRRKEGNQSFGFTRDLRLPDNLALRVHDANAREFQ